ncbi:MAG: ATP-binding protein, partial [Vulcanimicrobiaceae bacterium]
LAVISPAKLLALLAEPLRLLRNERRGSEGRATTLRAMIEWSYRLLSEDERSLFRRLAVLAGTFSIDTLVVLGPEHGGGAAFDVLASLVAKSMVVTQGEDEDGEQRFRLFESTRAFALEQLVAEGEREATERCFVAGISDAVRQRAKSLYTLGERHWLDGIERDFDNVRAALELAFGPLDDAEAGAEIAVSLGFFWHARRPQEGKHWLRRTRERADAFPQSLQARVFLESARVDVASANVVEFSERAVDGYRAAGDAPGLARALEYLGQSLINLGRSADAVAVLDESVALGEGAAASARSRALRGVAALLAGFDTAAAARDLESALPALTGAGRTRDASLALRGLAWLAGVDGRYDEALESAGRALALCESLHDPRGMALLHNELAFWYLRLERLADARANALEALRLAQNAEIPLTFNAIVLAGTLALGGRPRGAARALGFVDRPDPVSLLPFVTRYRSDIVQVLRARLGDEAFEAEAHSGDALSAAGLLRLFEEENAAPSVSGAV